VALWGGGDGTSVVYVDNDGNVSVERIKTTLKVLTFNTQFATSTKETLLSAVGDDGNTYFLFHNVKEGTVQFFEQPLSKFFPSRIFMMDDAFFCWYVGVQMDHLNEVSLENGKLQIRHVGKIPSHSIDVFMRKYAIDKGRKIALLTTGTGISVLSRESGRSTLSRINHKADHNALVGGLGSLKDGQFLCIIPTQGSAMAAKLLSFKTLCFLYVKFGKKAILPEIKTVSTGNQIADGLNKRCVVNGPYLLNGKFMFSAGMDFHLYDLASRQPLYSSTFYLTPSRLLVLGNTILAFQDPDRKIRSLNIGD